MMYRGAGCPPVSRRTAKDSVRHLFNTFAPDRRDDAKLGKMRADRIDHCGLLANERALSRR
jgi:hypothetical protein